MRGRADVDDHQREVRTPSAVSHSMVRELVSVDRVRKASPVVAS